MSANGEAFQDFKLKSVYIPVSMLEVPAAATMAPVE